MRKAPPATVPTAPPSSNVTQTLAAPPEPGSRTTDYIEKADNLYEQGKTLFLDGEYKKATYMMMEVEELAGGPYRNSGHYMAESQTSDKEPDAPPAPAATANAGDSSFSLGAY